MMKTEMLYGIHPVFEALKAGRREFFELYIVGERDSERYKDITGLLSSRKIPVKKVKPAQIEQMTGSVLHQGIVARVSEYPLIPFDDILNNIKPGVMDFLILLDNIVDPQNLGALVRTALCVGAGGVIITKDRSAFPTPAVSKASAGALEHISLSKTTNMINAIKEIKDKGLWIAGLDAMAGMPVYDCDFKAPIALVIGGEGKGIRPLVRSNCDFLVSIPQKKGISSLNASVAGAVVMYEVLRQRDY
ncbi:MAG: 23S rRNA (guanosine(2251)-2'-O)-methyltransferase RlmB [Desulfobacterales bacterium]|jgi:23S rRNA (guanosine2251-2'-O)-methyltransferase|nr:23S rRNA (guanosine(2251)-2'-O)-methyltransferase RlmB [Desulfobacterales bacterium]